MRCRKQKCVVDADDVMSMMRLVVLDALIRTTLVRGPACSKEAAGRCMSMLRVDVREKCLQIFSISVLSLAVSCDCYSLSVVVYGEDSEHRVPDNDR